MKLEAFFSSMNKANQTVAKLKSHGFSKAYVDLNDFLIDDDIDAKTHIPGTETTPNLSGLILGNGDTVLERDKGPLAAASPMVSGMAGFEEVGDYNCKLVVDITNQQVEQAEHIIKEMEGVVKVSSTKKPQDMGEIDLQK